VICGLQLTATNKVMYRPWSLAFQDTMIWYGMCLSSVIGSAAARSMASMVSCNSVTLGLASRSIDTDVITLPRTLLSHLQSYLSLASSILNVYISFGCWLTCRRSSTSIALGTKRILGMSDSSGVGLAHSAIKRMRLVLPLHTLQPYSVHGTAHPMSAASVHPQSAADCLIRSAIDISYPRQQGNPPASSSAASGPVRGDIINGLGAGTVGGVAILCCFLARLQASFPVLLTLLLLLRRRAVVTTRLCKVKHRIRAPLRVPRLVVPPLALTLTTRKPMSARLSP